MPYEGGVVSMKNQNEFIEVALCCSSTRVIHNPTSSAPMGMNVHIFFFDIPKKQNQSR